MAPGSSNDMLGMLAIAAHYNFNSCQSYHYNDHSCPHNFDYGWKYTNGIGGWDDAGKGVKIECAFK